ncbi:MAG: signal recognition particle-docking protein FtsY [Acidobacteria bacterium]|nr:signal recognition particle-docking protein FtsY [Acidobacteriota bacterium]NIM62067.1 signal recognition particle-docking protein FtsY [Acidobacteriota bacterium]NIO59716.1 signal recognition particle-docking protein FtsY [Acidobacteriota bacterium]NIQ30805.1 signal recognition particle-docking protein FtsY [Acidobacteriota bacterium]NIQ85867.1 signal recognition particle-docking protein FtsY [Acidobacteriota bacterium]
MALSIFKKLARGLSRTRESIASTLGGLGSEAAVDEETLEDLEAGLLAADLGPELTAEVIEAVREQTATDGSAVAAVRSTLRAALGQEQTCERWSSPHVVFVVGVNGGGKTTTVGKLAALEREAGRKAMIVAADTFRAAAIEQLERWSERSGAELVKQREGADPAAVVFDALKAATSRGIDTVLVDTAGRLHTKVNLMAELEKLGRIAAREVEGAPHEVLLVVDATTGQNGLTQAQEFTRAAELTGVVLTKLDGTAKGGVALVIQRKLGVPVRYVGVGEGLDDLLAFDPDAYVEGLLAV